jgi:hypothetical protein
MPGDWCNARGPIDWRVAGAVPDAVVLVPGPIASAQFAKQAVQTSGGRHPASSGEADQDLPVTIIPICTPICEALTQSSGYA